MGRFKQEIIKFWFSLKSDPLLLLFVISLIISQVYYSYRYILRYNSTATSPTAHDTPPEFQIGKYIITGAFYLLVILLLSRKDLIKRVWKSSKRHLVPATFLASLIFYESLSLLKFDPPSKNYTLTLLVKGIFFIPVAMIPFLITIRKNFINLLFKVLIVSLIFQILGFAYVYLNFTFFGRLPALAFANDLVRFGGIWDDPNAFAFFLLIPLFAILSLNDETQRKFRVWVISVLIVITTMGFLTLSLTVWIALLIGLVVFIIFRRQKTTLVNLSIIILTVITVAIVSPYSQNFISWKLNSLEERLYATLGIRGQVSHFIATTNIDPRVTREFIGEDKPEATSSAGLSNFLANYGDVDIISRIKTTLFGKSGLSIFNENYYLLTIFNFGLIGLSLLLLPFVYAFKSSLGILRKNKLGSSNHSLALFSLSFLVSSLVAMVGLPYLAIYPVSVYVWITIVLISIYKIRGINE